MKIEVIVQGVSLPLEPWSEDDARLVTQGISCPACKEPLAVFGNTATLERVDDETEEARAHCGSCKASVGRVRITYDTLFGLEEDDRVLKGRYRVY